MKFNTSDPLPTNHPDHYRTPQWDTMAESIAESRRAVYPTNIDTIDTPDASIEDVRAVEQLRSFYASEPQPRLPGNAGN